MILTTSLPTIASNIRHILLHCGSLRSDEKVAILCNATTRNIAEAFAKEARAITRDFNLLEIPLASKHGEEPPQDAKAIMGNCALILSLCQFSLAHTQARIDAGKNGARFLSLPCYNWDLLNDPAIGFDFKSQASIVRMIANKFSNGKTARVTTTLGTDIHLVLEGRNGNACPGYVEHPGDLGSPPDIEANISPLEACSEGKVVVDGSITCPEIGLLQTPVVLMIQHGRIKVIESENKTYVALLEAMLGGPDSPRRVLAECGVGLNPLARLTGTMLTDEGAMSCLHFGFGSNYTVGGKNKVDFHLDFVFTKASLNVDAVTILHNGKLVL